MSRRDPAKAVQVLDSMLEFFDGGKRWMRGQLGDTLGNRCLVGALRHMRAEFGIKGDGTNHYLRAVAPSKPDPSLVYLAMVHCNPSEISRFSRHIENLDADLMNFNDRSASYDEVRALIVEARAIAQAELEQAHVQCRPVRQPGAKGRVSRHLRAAGGDAARTVAGQ